MLFVGLFFRLRRVTIFDGYVTAVVWATGATIRYAELLGAVLAPRADRAELSFGAAHIHSLLL